MQDTCLRADAARSTRRQRLALAGRLKAYSGFRTRCDAFTSATLTRRRPHGHSCGVPCPRTRPARCVLPRGARHAKRTCLEICRMRAVALSGHSSRATNAARRVRSASRRVGTARGAQGAPLSPCVVAQQCRPQPLAGKPHERCKALHSGAPVRVSQAAPAGRIVAGIRMSRARQQSAAAAGYGRFSAAAKDAPSRATENPKKAAAVFCEVAQWLSTMHITGAMRYT